MQSKQIKFRGEFLRDTKLGVMPSQAVRYKLRRTKYVPHVGKKQLARLNAKTQQ